MNVKRSRVTSTATLGRGTEPKEGEASRCNTTLILGAKQCSIEPLR